jgi:hypothetical protein
MKRLLASALLFATTAAAQVQSHPDLTAIQDNSFLIEEAYNQEDGVVQHISVFQRDSDGDAWGFASNIPFGDVLECGGNAAAFQA